MAVNIFRVSRQWLISDLPKGRLLSESRDLLTSTKPPGDLVKEINLAKQWLISDKTRAKLYAESIDYLTATSTPKEYSYLYKEYTQVLYRVLDLVFYGEYKQALMVLNSVPTIHAVALQAQQYVWQKSLWPTVADTISIETTYQVVQQVLRKSTFPFDQSVTKVLTARQLALLNYPMGMPFGIEEARQVIQLALQSDDQEHVSISMDYVATVAELVLRSQPLAIYKSDVFALSVSQLLLRRTPMGYLPQSDTVTRQAAFKVLQGLTGSFLPQSFTGASQSVQLAMYAWQDPLPLQGTNEVRETVETVLQNSDFPTPRSTTSSRQLAEMVLHAQSNVVQSFDIVRETDQLVLQKADYLPPANMTGVFSYQMRETVMASAFYPSPDIVASFSVARGICELVLRSDNIEIPRVSAFVSQAMLLWSMQTAYPSPGDMIPPKGSAISPSVTHVTLQSVTISAIQSYDAVRQLAHTTLQHAAYDSPDDMFFKGIFAWQVSETVARQSDFPDPSDVFSSARSDMVLEVLATVDDSFPDPTEQPQPVMADQVAEQVASATEYPDPNGVFSSAKTEMIGQQVAIPETFPDTSLPLSEGRVSAVIEQKAISDEFPDPANLTSPATASQIVGQLAQSADYPDPAKTGSNVNAYHVSQMVAVPDETLNGVPEYVVKHRPVITVNIVYSTKS